jgi:hypothetical protein
MDEAKRELVQAWLIKARNDLTAARELGALADGLLDAAFLSLIGTTNDGGLVLSRWPDTKLLKYRKKPIVVTRLPA